MLNLSLGLSLGSLATTRGGSAASRLLNLIKNDTGTALIWDYAKTDRRFAEPIGGANPVASGDVVGLDLDSSKWGGKTLAQVIADQPELTLNGGLDGAANWSARGESSISGGIARVKTTDGSYSAIEQVRPLAFKPMTLYAVQFDLLEVIAGQVALDLYGTSTVLVPGGVGRKTVLVRTPAFPGDVIPSPALFSIKRFQNSVPAEFTIDNISIKEIPGNHARQGTGSSKPKWQAGPKPFLLFDGVDDQLDTELIPNAAGTMAIAFRSTAPKSTSQFALAGGETTGDKRARIGIDNTGRPSVSLNNAYNVVNGNYFDQDLIMVQTWGGGRRRCYLHSLPELKFLDDAFTANTNGTGNVYKIGTLELGGERLIGRVYGALIRSVQTSDADVRNIILPAFKGLF